MSACTKVLVTDLPETATREKVFTHFQNTSKSGGGEIKSLIYPIQRSGKAAAVVEFENETVAASVLQTQQAYRSRKVPITVSPFENELFENATAELDTATLKQYPTSEQILQDAGVKISESAEKTIVSGDWYKINFIANELQKLTGGSNMQKFKAAISKAKRRDEKTDVKTAEDMNTTDPDSSPEEVSKGKPSAHKAIAASSPMSEVKSDYDGSLFSYTYLTRKEDVEAILYDCNVTVSYFRDVTGDVCVSWQSGSEGSSRFKKLYDQTRHDACQRFYDIPPGYDANGVFEVLKEARRRNPLVQMELTKGQFEGKILFIGENERACKVAISDLRWLLHHPIYGTPRSSEVLFSHKSAGGIHFQICRGDIAKEDTEAIVNAANRRLADGAGVTGAIYSAGGYQLQDECRELIRNRGRQLDVGEIVHTNAYGKLKCRYVLHVAAPMSSEFKGRNKVEECQKVMKKLCWDLIKYANDRLQITSLALPAIGTGIYGISMEVFCRALLYSLTKLDEEYGITVKEIRLVNYDHSEAGQLVRIIKKELPQSFNESAI